MIAGRNCLQGGIDMSGIAHAEGIGLQPAGWFSGDDSVRYPALSLTALSSITFAATIVWGGQVTQTTQVLFTAPINNGSILIGYSIATQTWICQWLTSGGLYRGRGIVNTPLATSTLYIISVTFNFSASTITVSVNGSPVTGAIIPYTQLTPGNVCEVGNRNTSSSLPYKGTVYDIKITTDGGTPISIPGHGNLSSDWIGGTIIGSLQKCFVRRDGTVVIA